MKKKNNAIEEKTLFQFYFDRYSSIAFNRIL